MVRRWNQTIWLHRAPKGTKCCACHRAVGGETVCGHTTTVREVGYESRAYCWRCEHTVEGTELFCNAFKGFLVRKQKGPWWYLSPRTALLSLFDLPVPPLPPALGGSDV